MTSIGPKKRKPYTHLACQACKDKHLKCDGNKPQCGNCMAKRLECHYREERNRRRESSQSQAQQQRLEDDLRDKIISLEQEVEKWKQKYFQLKEIAKGVNISFNEVPFQTPFGQMSPPSPNQMMPNGDMDMGGVMQGQDHGMREQRPEMWRRRSHTLPNDMPYGTSPDYAFRYGEPPRFHDNIVVNPQDMVRCGGYLYEGHAQQTRRISMEYTHSEPPYSPQLARHHDQFGLYSQLRPHSAPGIISLPTSHSAPVFDHASHDLSTTNSVPAFDTHYPDKVSLSATGSAPACFETGHYPSNHPDAKPSPMTSGTSSFDPRVFSSLVDSKPADGTSYESDLDHESHYHGPPADAVVYAPHNYSMMMLGGPAPMRGDEEEENERDERGNTSGRYQISNV